MKVCKDIAYLIPLAPRALEAHRFGLAPSLCTRREGFSTGAEMVITEKDKLRFFRAVQVMPGQCWPWLKHKYHGGYGQIVVGGKARAAHRVSWTIHKGEIPEGLQVLHACDNPGCVNPHHLWLGNNADNMADKMRKGRYYNGRAWGNATRCARGHALTPDNIYFHVGEKRTYRACIACMRIRRHPTPTPNHERGGE